MLYHVDHQLITDENDAFQLAALSVIGDREDQQDSLGYTLKQNAGLLVVCDGMGGHAGGKTASELAVGTFLSQYEQPQATIQPTEWLTQTAKATDTLITQLQDANGNRLQAGSTVVSVLVNGKDLLWCAVGDSRAYLIRNGEMVQLTQDHNYHTVLVEKRNAGLLDAAEFEKEDARGEALISFLGIGNLALIDYSKTPFKLQTDDKIVIMSDGLYKTVTDAEIFRILDNFNNIGEAVGALEMKSKKNAKNQNESRDNITIALIKIK